MRCGRCAPPPAAALHELQRSPTLPYEEAATARDPEGFFTPRPLTSPAFPGFSGLGVGLRSGPGDTGTPGAKQLRRARTGASAGVGWG